MKFWMVMVSTVFLLILAYTAMTLYVPIKFSAKRDGDHIMVEVYDVVVDIPPDRDTAGVFIKFPDKSIQFVPVLKSKTNAPLD